MISDQGTGPFPEHQVRKWLLVVVSALVGITAVAAVVLWPSGNDNQAPNINANSTLIGATVESPSAGPCPEQADEPTCYRLATRLDEGPEKGSVQYLELNSGPGNPTLHKDQRIVLERSTAPESEEVIYNFSDFDRKGDLAFLAAAFAFLVVLVGRWRGVGAIFGLIFTGLILVKFMLPAILEGSSPVTVAVVASSMIVLVTLYVAHGLNVRTTTAVIGTLVSLGVVGVLSGVANSMTELSGIASDEANYVQQVAGSTVNINALLVAGFIIGSLGVLNDMTVTQASAVWEIHAAQPTRSFVDIYRSGMRVGRDHIASTVYTLVLAYVGAALPVLILFTLSHRNALDVANGELLAEEIVRSLVGAIGLIASVPVTTGLAAFLVRITGSSSEQPTLPGHGHGHGSETKGRRFRP